MPSYANCPVLDMHQTPDATTATISQARYGEPIKLLEKTNHWNYIETPDGYRGWIPAGHLQARKTPYPSTSKIAVVDAHWAYLFLSDDITSSPPVMQLPFGTRLEVASNPTKLHERWMQVHLLDDKKTLWAQTGDFRINPLPFSLSEMLEVSKRFIGVPYRWGGTTSFGFDCSGFVQMLFREAGILLPRDAYQQAAAESTETVEREKLQPGDLLFFKNSSEKIAHVGLYHGDGSFIHAVTTNAQGHHTVQVSHLSDTEWSNRYVLARRVLI